MKANKTNNWFKTGFQQPIIAFLKAQNGPILTFVLEREEEELLMHSFIHSGYFYSASSSPLLLRGTPDNSIDTVSELTRQSATGNYN